MAFKDLQTVDLNKNEYKPAVLIKGLTYEDAKRNLETLKANGLIDVYALNQQNSGKNLLICKGVCVSTEVQKTLILSAMHEIKFENFVKIL